MDLPQPVLQSQIATHGYVFAVTFMAVAKIAVLLVNRTLTKEWLPINYVALAAIMPAIVISTPVQSGEEMKASASIPDR